VLGLDPQFMSIDMRCSNGDGHEAITMRELVEY
jgi:hypothetical protein